MVGRSQASAQLKLCIGVRQACAASLVALHGSGESLPPPAVDAANVAPDAASVDASLTRLYGSNASLPTDTFRRWLATEPAISPLFAPIVP